MDRRRRRIKQLLDDLKEKPRYWNLKQKHLNSFYGQLTLEEVMDMSQDRLRNEREDNPVKPKNNNTKKISIQIQQRSSKCFSAQCNLRHHSSGMGQSVSTPALRPTTSLVWQPHYQIIRRH